MRLRRAASARNPFPGTSRVDWGSFDPVVIRSTWDYAPRRDEFVRRATVGDRLQNRAAWSAGTPTSATSATSAPTACRSSRRPTSPPATTAPEIDGEVVVKPTVSAGARGTGRFGPGPHGRARDLMERIDAAGHTAMVQPFVAASTPSARPRSCDRRRAQPTCCTRRRCSAPTRSPRSRDGHSASPRRCTTPSSSSAGDRRRRRVRARPARCSRRSTRRFGAPRSSPASTCSATPRAAGAARARGDRAQPLLRSGPGADRAPRRRDRQPPARRLIARRGASAIRSARAANLGEMGPASVEQATAAPAEEARRGCDAPVPPCCGRG